MVPGQQNSQLCLLLGLLGMTILVHAPPPGKTPAQWFVIQHILNVTRINCNIAMQAINRYNYFHRICVNKNTFLHTPLNSVAQVCRSRNITCSNGLNTNCHSSPLPVVVTDCTLTRFERNYKLCQYQQTNGWKYYDVACNNNYRAVHLDRVY